MVQANGADLSLFQFDYDLTFAAFFLNADRTIYGRYGTRSTNKEAARDISIEGFQKALAAALALHRHYPQNRAALAAKTGPAPDFKAPEDYPSLAVRYRSTIDFPGKLAQSCIHCHMVRDAQRKVVRSAAKPLPDPMLYPWPMPDLVGLVFDPKEKASLQSVTKDSAADRAGFHAGDEILTLQGQPIISIADVQWVLQQAKPPVSIEAEVRRGLETRQLTLPLPTGWRRASDISWRPTTWDLRRMATGGLVLENLPDADRKAAGIPKDALALRVKFVGQYGEHAAAKKAGFQKGDIFLSVDGKAPDWTESDALGYLLQNHTPGDQIGVTVLRQGQKLDMRLPSQ